MRRFFARAALALLLLTTLGGAAPAPVNFAVLRNGYEIGTLVMRFVEEGDLLHVDTEVRIEYRFLLIPIYRYEHRARETWRGAALVAVDANTDDDGTKRSVRVRGGEEGLVAEGPKGRIVLPKDILTTSFWRQETVKQARLFDPNHGRLYAISVAEANVEDVSAWLGNGSVKARRYVVSGELDRELWYAEDGSFVRLRFTAADGSLVEYRRR